MNPAGSNSDVFEDTGAHRLPIGTRIGEFELTGLVGEGGFSIVYLAWDHSLERKVALKEFMPSSLATRSARWEVLPRSQRHQETFEAGLKSFVNEGKLLAQFDHPALVKVYRFWEANGTAYMVMPFYEGVTLKERMRSSPQPPSEEWLLGMLDPLSEALTVIHREQCFHRDIAPDNVLLLSSDGKPLLLDFGAARRVIGDRTQALTVILKPGFAPVEQYAEDIAMKQGPWTDVYALAAVIYWTITGKSPPVSVGRMIKDSYVPLASSAAGRYSSTFLAAVDHALSVLPEQRTPSIERFREELGLARKAAKRDEQKTVIWSDPNATIMELAPKREPARVPDSAMPMHVSISPAAVAPPPPDAHLAGREPRRRVTPVVAIVVAILTLASGAAWWFVDSPKPPAKAIDPSAGVVPPGATATPAAPPAATTPPRAESSAPPRPAEQTVRSETVTAQAAFDRLLMHGAQEVEVSASAQAGVQGLPASQLRLSYRATEPGYLYVMGTRPGSNELTLFHPLPGAAARRAGLAGFIDVAAPVPDPSGPRLLLLLARERRDAPVARWTVRDRVRVRTFEAGSEATDTDPSLLGPPQCARVSATCDAAFGVTEVMQVTNVMAPPPPPQQPASHAAEANERPPKTGGTKSAAPPAKGTTTEGKQPSPPSKGSAQECVDILQRLSLGEPSPELIERMKTLRCGS